MKIKQEICASFTVENEDHVLKQVIVTQDILSHYNKEDSYSKKFRLESLDGPVVYRTEDPDIFKLDNGMLLKKRKNRL
jgi:hypothetical protein